MNVTKQTTRIKNKLKRAKEYDQDFKVFGADSHRYFINPPIPSKEIKRFEEEYDIILPSCYKAFLLEIGNGGSSFLDSAAGPYYGIFPLGEEVDFIFEKPAQSLSQPTKIYPNMTDQEWETLIKQAEEEEWRSDQYDLDFLYAGVLPIGSQGCSYLHGLILNGEHSGRVVNLAMQYGKPLFTTDNNFLDWYERWLDEIISSKSLTNHPSWFGY